MKTRTSFKKGHPGLYHAVGAQNHRYKHGLARDGQFHPLYRKWESMKRRCFNSHEKCYPRYGGRGITVCKRWMNVENFIHDMEPSFKPGLTLDRKDNSKGYSPDNCRWATLKEQSFNRRSTVAYKGETAKDASIRLGGSASLVSERIRNGWMAKKAFTTPVAA